MYKILLTYFSIAISCIVVIVAFITSTNYVQLAFAILLYPVVVFFTFKVIPTKSELFPKKKIKTHEQALVKPADFWESPKKESLGISDIDKRVFLKLIGSTGLFFFIFSLFNKKGEDILLKYLPRSASSSNQTVAVNQNDSSQSGLPIQGYVITDIDDGFISYYGFTNKNGAWYIMRMDAEVGSYRYAKGDKDFPGSWNNREKLHYDYFHTVFNI